MIELRRAENNDWLFGYVWLTHLVKSLFLISHQSAQEKFLSRSQVIFSRLVVHKLYDRSSDSDDWIDEDDSDYEDLYED